MQCVKYIGVWRFDEENSVHSIADVVVENVMASAEQADHVVRPSEALREELRLELVPEQHQVLQRIRSQNRQVVGVALKEVRTHAVLVELRHVDLRHILSFSSTP